MLAAEVLISNSTGLRWPEALQYNNDVNYAESRLWAGPIVRWFVGRLRDMGTSLVVPRVCSI